MDLPTTDPGSDLYDLTDSADESNRIRSVAETKDKCSDEETQFIAKENEKSNFDLPLIIRPRSLSLGEEITSADLVTKNKRRLRRRRLPRPLRNLSPVVHKSQDVQIKLVSLRRQIWTGMRNCEQRTEENIEYSLIDNYPLSWGVSKMAVEYQTDNETLLECSKKLEELNYNKIDVKKSKKKTRKKSTKPIEIPPVINVLEEENRQTTKKKKPRGKRQRGVKSSLEPLDNNTILLTSEGLDSLKLFGTAKLPKVQPKLKMDSKRKLNKAVIAAAITTSKLKAKPVIDSIGDSSSSENSPLVSRHKSIKKKSCIMTGKKRVQSAPSAKKESK